MRKVIEHGAVDAALLEQVGIYPAHVFVSLRQLEFGPDVLTRFHRRGRYVLAQEHLHGIRKAGVKIFAHKVNGCAAFVFVLVEPGVPAYSDVVVSPSAP